MQIKHSETDSKGKFFISEGEETCAEMTYSKAGDSLIIIDHTEVNDLFKGKGFGLMLLEEVVRFVRKKGIKIMPLCPFANAMMKKHPEFHDTLK